MDPFLDLIRLLRPQATLWRRVDGSGRWGISFHKRDDVLFCLVSSGRCLLLRPGFAALRLETGDFVLVRTTTPFSLASDEEVACIDSERTLDLENAPHRKLGEGEERPVTLHGGKFVFDSVNEDLLTGMLPQILHIGAGDRAAWRVHGLLAMNEAESESPGPGSEFVIARLMELVLIDLLRTNSLRADVEHSGMLAGLADPIIAAALGAMHREVARGWTVAELARLVGVSRSAFAERFRKVVGIGPIDYLLRWRMALAKDKLREGRQTLSEIAFAIGFQSPSAFSTAFSRAVGVSPSCFREDLKSEGLKNV